MTDYNSMKSDEYAQRQGEMDELDNAIDVMELIVSNEMDEKAWFECLPMNEFRTVIGQKPSAESCRQSKRGMSRDYNQTSHRGA